LIPEEVKMRINARDRDPLITLILSLVGIPPGNHEPVQDIVEYTGLSRLTIRSLVKKYEEIHWAILGGGRLVWVPGIPNKRRTYLRISH
jgi:hypothetical protein